VESFFLIAGIAAISKWETSSKVLMIAGIIYGITNMLIVLIPTIYALINNLNEIIIFNDKLETDSAFFGVSRRLNIFSKKIIIQNIA